MFFNSEQRRNTAIWVILMAPASWFLADWGWIDVFQVRDFLLTVSVVLLGFSLTVLSLMTKAAGEIREDSWLHQILSSDNNYEKLISNGRWLIFMLLVNIIIGFVLAVMSQDKIEEIPLCISVWLQALLAMELTFTYALLWYAVWQYAAVITNKEE